MKPIFLKDARKAKKLTQARLAEKVRKPQSYISKLENGTIADPGISNVRELARVLGVDPLALRFGQQEVA